jgi:hypothetical protein
LWLLLGLVAGGPSAFLALEGAGIPYAALAIVALIWVGRRRHILPETLLAFGLTYAAVIFRFAIGELIAAVQQGDYALAAYAVAQIDVAVGIVGAGVLLLTRRGPSSATMPSS